MSNSVDLEMIVLMSLGGRLKRSMKSSWILVVAWKVLLGDCQLVGPQGFLSRFDTLCMAYSVLDWPGSTWCLTLAISVVSSNFSCYYGCFCLVSFEIAQRL